VAVATGSVRVVRRMTACTLLDCVEAARGSDGRAGAENAPDAPQAVDSTDFPGTWSSGIGRVVNRRRQLFAMTRATGTERSCRAESVAIPVFAYIWR
jgi:hypothetical protein